MRFVVLILFFISGSTFAIENFSSKVTLCTYPLPHDKDGKMLLFNFKSRSVVKILLTGKEVAELQKGPYRFDLEILNPKYQEQEYQAKILKFKPCIAKEVVRFVDGELKPREEE